MGTANWERFEHRALHWLLIENVGDKRELPEEEAAQALFCPYYVPLEGRLGADWGVIVNPSSARFGKLTFEHHDCGCPGDEDRHAGAPSQMGDTWDMEWSHTCDVFCDTPCEWIKP